jgi:uracil-DNA glycosylase
MATWKEFLNQESKKMYFKSLQTRVGEAYKTTAVYPKREDIMNALKYCPYDKVKVVILGQDPYHGEGQAHGLAFSTPDGVIPPPSLRNIFKEIRTNYDLNLDKNGLIPIQSPNLIRWAKQGVLLLNTVMTVEAGKPGSHANIGWETFTDNVIKKISIEKTGVVFMLWGNYAHKKISLINQDKHAILKAAHPSPLSSHRGFFGCNHFYDANVYLLVNGETPIDWR